MIHTVVRTDKMTGTDNRAYLVSVKFDGDLDNGRLVKLDGLMEGEREVFKAVVPAGEDKLDVLALVASPEVMYDERLRNLHDFYNVDGKIARAYLMHEHDIFSLTTDAFEGEPAVGQTVGVGANGKFKVGVTGIGKIIDKNVVGRYTYFAVQVG